MSSERIPAGAVVIEFAGCPGAGKTTAALEMTRILRARGLDAVSMVEAARPHAARTRVGRAVAVLPARWRGPLLWQVYRWHGRRGARAFREDRVALAGLASRSDRHTKTWFFRLAGRMRFLVGSPEPGEVLVIDDGFLHRSVALHASPSVEPDLTAVAAFVDLLEQPALAVHVRASVPTCAARVRERGLWRHRAGWSDEDLDRYVVNASAVVEAAVARARERGWNVVDVDNERPVADQMHATLEAAADLIRPRAVTGGAA
ncbi:MAG: hypothetical protein WD096_11405 [Actinomycetota bacterium]